MTRSTILRATLAALFLVGVAGFTAAGCADGDSVDATEGADQGDDAISGSDAVARAEQWVAVQLKYCQAPNGGRDYDDACSTYCSRQSNAAWDAYRSDCSGLVSWAWGLPAPGRTTEGFAPNNNDVTHVIDANDLQAGDAVNGDGHVMLFKNWISPGHSAVFIEEPGCSSSRPYARETTSSVSISGSAIYISSNGKHMTAIRFNGSTGGANVGLTGCTQQEIDNNGNFGCACVDHHGDGGFCPGTGCSAEETSNAAQFGCQCVDHQGNGGFCPGTGCTAKEETDAAKFGCQCVDHKGAGGFCPGTGCTAKEETDAAKFGCQCVDHKGDGGFCPGTGCTAKEEADAAKFGCGCVDHKGAGGFCPGTGCTAKETNDCAASGQACELHACK